MSELKAFNCVESDLQEFCEPRLVYLKDDVDKMIAAKDAEIAALRTMTKEPCVPNRTCRKCGQNTLMYMPIVEDENTFLDLYNNKGIDYVFGIQCAHCGEIAFVTKQTYEYQRKTIAKLKEQVALLQAEFVPQPGV